MTDARLTAEDISIARGGRRVVTGVDLAAAPGEVLAILGPNGAGKSTLLSALAGLLPFEGSLRLGRDDVTQLGAAERARAIAYVPQRSHLNAPLAVRAVIEQGRFPHRGAFGAMRPADRDALARAVARTDVEALLDRRFDRLSLGERRRVLLARALCTEAPVLLLDEPTASLDIGHELDLHALLRGLAGEGYAIVVVLHGLDAARRHSDRALLLEDGRVRAIGAVDRVITDDEVRAVYGVRLHEDGGLGFSRERS